ncbi:MAG: radical SAM protein [Ruminococcaceae bacterium]|nr:radical SAM protein [Oscillospiraceae bacterium]
MTELICKQCPRRCGALRTAEKGEGYCKMPLLPKAARASLHMWEEPPISGTRGSGTVFFSGCVLGCVFCQNEQISHGGEGKVISVARLREAIDKLVENGAHNINLVNPTHYAHILPELLTKPTRLNVPVVYNSGGYENVHTLRNLQGLVDIYLPDIKYYSGELSARYSKAEDYFERAIEAVQEMYRQVGRCEFDENGIMKKGVIVRHLVLPNAWRDSIKVFEKLKELFPNGEVEISVMSQYTPCGKLDNYPELKRRLTSLEYDKVVKFLVENDMTKGYMQDRRSASEEYIPPFDLTGI